MSKTEVKVNGNVLVTPSQIMCNLKLKEYSILKEFYLLGPKYLNALGYTGFNSEYYINRLPYLRSPWSHQEDRVIVFEICDLGA